MHYLGTRGYHGVDPETKQRFHACPGETVVVSDTKAAQLLECFPGEWKDRGPFLLQPAGRAPNIQPIREPEHTL